MSTIRKIKRNMAHKQLEDEGNRRVNSRVRIPGAPSGKIGKNSRYGVRISSSDFALHWKKAFERRVKTFDKQNNNKRKVRKRNG